MHVCVITSRVQVQHVEFIMKADAAPTGLPCHVVATSQRFQPWLAHTEQGRTPCVDHARDYACHRAHGSVCARPSEQA